MVQRRIACLVIEVVVDQVGWVGKLVVRTCGARAAEAAVAAAARAVDVTHFARSLHELLSVNKYLCAAVTKDLGGAGSRYRITVPLAPTGSCLVQQCCC